jgi:dTDP-4-dehydrorhamnose reductase
VRSSFIGHSLSSHSGLLDWLLAADQPVLGYYQAFWNGITSLELAKFISYAIRFSLNGLIHVGGERISKGELLKRMADVYEKQIQIIPCAKFCSDHSLRSIRKNIQFMIPPLEAMLREYRQWHTAVVKPSI